MSIDDFRRELIATRAAIQRDYAGLRHQLDFVGRTKQSVVKKPLPWLGGAAAIGYLLSGRRRARKLKKAKSKDGEEAAKLTVLGVLLAIVRFALPLVRPALTSFAANKLGEYATKRFSPSR